ncbi:MAG: metallophosphoesterase [Pedobacter sp.]|uniref:metallophosphoesterase family protein n=1 Tax=Pedobacter sp. TaxID=1411316 RepID=UPI0035663BB4
MYKMLLKNSLFLLVLTNLFFQSSSAQSHPENTQMWTKDKAYQLNSASRLNKEKRNKDLKILLISDLNDSYGSVSYSNEVHDIISKIEIIKPDLVLCAGDMVAGQKKSLTIQQLDNMWNGFQSTVLDPLHKQGIPFGFTLGNHDASPNYINDRNSASKFWLQNKRKINLTFVDDHHFPYYFSYIKNNIFFISWDASSAIIPDEVKTWMQGQLLSSVAIKARGKIVLGHLPLYAIVDAKNKPGEVLDEADKTLFFLKNHGVDMYISGHQHVYYPASKEQVTLLHSGCLGGGPRSLIGHDEPAYKSYEIIKIARKSSPGKAEIQGYKADAHSQIQHESLPKSVTGFNGTVNRISPITIHSEKLH